MGTLSEWFLRGVVCANLDLRVFGNHLFVQPPSASWLAFGQYFGGIYPGQHRVLVSVVAWNRRTGTCRISWFVHVFFALFGHASDAGFKSGCCKRVRMMYLDRDACARPFICV